MPSLIIGDNSLPEKHCQVFFEIFLISLKKSAFRRSGYFFRQPRVPLRWKITDFSGAALHARCYQKKYIRAPSRLFNFFRNLFIPQFF